MVGRRGKEVEADEVALGLLGASRANDEYDHEEEEVQEEARLGGTRKDEFVEEDSDGSSSSSSSSSSSPRLEEEEDVVDPEMFSKWKKHSGLDGKPADYPWGGTRDKFELFSFDEAPAYLQHNPYIRTGFRVDFSWRLCAFSIFRLHNEFFNIWTHLLGFILFFVLGVLTLVLVTKSPGAWDSTVFTIFVLCIELSMFGSTFFHTFHCHSPSVYKWTARLDYSGISFLIVGSFYPILYFGFACVPGWRIVYLTAITLVGVCGICLSWMPVFATPRYIKFRTGFYIGFGWLALVPIPHLLYLHDFWLVWEVGWRELVMGALYTIGAVVYMKKIPECWFPGRFDVSIFNSHSLWHIITTLAALMQLWTCVYAFRMQGQIICY